MSKKVDGWRSGVFLAAAAAVLFLAAARAWADEQKPVEITEFQGTKLSPFDKTYLSSMKGTQTVDPAAYRLEISGLVDSPQTLTYEEVLGLPGATRLVTIHCVEGWTETLLFEGVRISDLIDRALPGRGVKTVIFWAVDGYSSSLDYQLVKDRDLILAAKVNGLTLSPVRGFPFQVVAQDKFGYKWVRWVSKIVLSDQPFKGYTENMGYSNEADLPEKYKGGK